MEANRIPILECLSCGHRWALIEQNEDHVNRVYGDAYFTGGGAGYANYIENGRIVRTSGRRYAQLMSKYLNPGTVLDVGAAAGFFLQGLRDCGWDGRGIEPNQSMARHAREVLEFPVSECCIEDFDEDRRYDLVTMIQVLPHLIDPKGAIKRVADLVKPRGHLLIETWNFESLTARIWGRRWHEYSPPSVLHWFTPISVRRLGEEAGFVQVGNGRPKKHISAAHAKSLLKYKVDTPFARQMLDLVDLFLPGRFVLRYPAEDLFWSVFQLRPSEVHSRSAQSDQV